MRTRALPLLLVPAMALVLAGCLLESTLDAKGGGTLKVQMRGTPNDTLDRVKSRFEGPGIEIKKATVDDKKNIDVEITFTDFRALGAMKQFPNTTFSLTEDVKAKTRTVQAVTKYPKPVKLPDDQVTYFGKDVTVSITLPGDIVKTNGKQSAKTVKWELPLNKMLGEETTTFEVTYKSDGSPLPPAPKFAAPLAAGAAAAAPVAATPQPKK